MDLRGLIDTARQRLDDGVAPYHVEDQALAKFAAEAEQEAALRGRLIYDDSTAITKITVVAGQHTYPLDSHINHIEAVSFTREDSLRPRDLDMTGMDSIRQDCAWHTRSSSRPYKAVHLEPQCSIRIWPTPSQAGTLELAVYRAPMFDLEDDDDEPEIPQRHHDGLVSWILYRVYSSKDSELNDDARAGAALAEFTSRFGQRDTADVMRRHRERRRITTRYGGI